MKKWGIQAIILLGLLLLVEVGFRLAGHRAGVFDKSFVPVDTLIHEPRHWCGPLGINRYVQDSPYLPDGYVINKDGFRNDFEFEKAIVDYGRSTANHFNNSGHQKYFYFLRELIE